ncbi:MAG: ester cyclase [Chloroflexota bacterium]|nr:ester cyclase [Chloroflexota bacterium]
MTPPTESNKSLILRFNDEVFNHHDVDAVERFLAADHFNHVSGATGVQDFKQIVRYILNFAPESRSEIDELVAEGDQVVAFLTWTGTHRGEVQVAGRAFPPTGARFSVRQVHRYRVVDGRIVEHAAIRDDLALLRQLEDAADDAPLETSN